jgi:predicted amidohydrolase
MSLTTSSSLAVAAIQLTSTPDVDASLSSALHYLEEAASAGADLAVLPENFGFLGSEKAKLAYAQSIEEGSFVAPLRELAAKKGMGIIAGGMPEKGPDDERVYNTAVFIGRSGEVAGSYRKIHLFDIDLAGKVSYKESAAVLPGTEPMVVEFEGWKVGLSICYDLRFPEMYRSLVDQGAHILTVPAAFTLQTGRDHWEVLLRARAIENQCYVIAAGQVGEHLKGRASWGQSCVIDPWGTILQQAPDAEGITVATIDRSELQRIRTQLPCLEHRRL